MDSWKRDETDILTRVEGIASRFGQGEQCAAWHLCDRHDRGSLAYRIVGEDMDYVDLSYGELRSASQRLAAGFRAMGLGEGDRIATLMGKSRDYLVSLMAIWRIGAVHLPLFTAFAPAAIAYRLASSAARLVICDSDQMTKLEPGIDMPADRDWSVATTGKCKPEIRSLEEMSIDEPFPPEAAHLPADAPLIHIFTSGTTGKPKGLTVPIRALAAIQTYMELALNVTSQDVYWCAADPGWAYGLYYGVVGSFLTGTTSILLEGGFSPARTLAVLERERVTNFAAAPTVYRAMRASGEVPTHPLALRHASSAGDPLTPDVNDWARDVLGVEVHDHYGQTETGMLINNHHHPSLARPLVSGSMGVAMPGWTAAILGDKSDEQAAIGEVGRVAILLAASPLAWFGGYIGAEDRTAERFTGDRTYYLTGDVGRQDEDGNFHFSARDDDVILMAGYRIGPGEIENIIAAHPAVVECGVTAIPDPIRGEVMEAFVVLRDGITGDEALATDIQQWVKTRYAAHAFPRAVHFTGSLPKTPSGKLQRIVLKQRRIEQLANATS